MRYIIAQLLLVAILLIARLPIDQGLTLRVLDIGQGDSIYLRLPSHDDVLVDAGPDDRVLGQLGRYMPFADRTIELLIVSHNHQDHIGGLEAILSEYTVNHIWLSGATHPTQTFHELLSLIEAKNIPVTFVKAGDVNTIGDSELTVLHPPTTMVDRVPLDPHNATIVLKVSYKKICIILTGDIEERHEVAVVDTVRQLAIPIECPVLKVTHHGSRYGTFKPFLEAVKPEVGLVSVGAKNRYGHPTTALLDRLKVAKVKVYRTDWQGTITVKSNGERYSTKVER